MARGNDTAPAETAGFSGNFSELGQIKANEVQKPRAHPGGHYTAQFSGPMTQHKAAKTGNVAMRFPFKIIAAGDDVTLDERGLPDKTYNIDFWMSPEARYRFTDFCCKAQGLSDSLDLLSLAEQLVAENKPFSIQNTPAQDEKDPEVSYNRWDNPSSAD